MSVAGPPTKDGPISLAGLSMPGSEPHRFWIPKLGLASRASRIELVEKSDFPPPSPSPFFRDWQRIVHYYMGVISF